MQKGILYVETRPIAPEEEEAYHKWYNEIHLPEVVSIEGVLSARRFGPVGDDGPFITVYELEANDIEAVQQRIGEASQSGRLTIEPVYQTDPPPTVRYYKEIASYVP
jgi:hypothetical protein